MWGHPTCQLTPTRGNQGTVLNHGSKGTLHPELEFMWVLLLHYMAVNMLKQRTGESSQKTGANAAGATATQITANYARSQTSSSAHMSHVRGAIRLGELETVEPYRQCTGQVKQSHDVLQVYTPPLQEGGGSATMTREQLCHQSHRKAMRDSERHWESSMSKGSQVAM